MQIRLPQRIRSFLRIPKDRWLDSPICSIKSSRMYSEAEVGGTFLNSTRIGAVYSALNREGFSPRLRQHFFNHRSSILDPVHTDGRWFSIVINHPQMPGEELEKKAKNIVSEANKTMLKLKSDQRATTVFFVASDRNNLKKITNGKLPFRPAKGRAILLFHETNFSG